MFTKRGFGQFDIVMGLLPSVISAGGSVASAYIGKSAATGVAKMGQTTQLMQLGVQQRLAQLQIEAYTKAQVAKTVTPTLETPGAIRTTGTVGASQTLTAGIIPENIFGVPVIYLVLGAGLIFFFTKRTKVKGGTK